MEKVRTGNGHVDGFDRLLVQSRLELLEAAVRLLRISLQPFAEGHVCPVALERARKAYEQTALEKLL